MAIVTKIISWVMANGASLLGVLQALIKAVKELLTAVINLISLFIPGVTAQGWVDAVRNALNVVDSFIEKIKAYFLPKTV
jgi:predicted aspartyl protease